MKITLRLLHLILLCLPPLACATEAERPLMARTAPRDELPNFKDIVEYEVVEGNQVLHVMEYKQRVFHQGWFKDNNGNQYNGYWELHPKKKILSKREATKPVPPPAQTTVPAVPASPAAEPQKLRSPIRPSDVPEQAGESLPTEPPADPTAERKPRPVPLLRNEPALANQINWSEGGGFVDRKATLEALEQTLEAVFKWQANIRGRLNLCPVDEAEARQNGTLEKFYVPQTVASGRVWILKMEIAELVYLLENLKLEDEEFAGRLVRVVRRLESLDSQMGLLSQNGEAAYYFPLMAATEKLKSLGTSFNPYVDEADKRWVARWQGLSIDLQLWIEREEKLTAKQPVTLAARESKKLLQEALGEIDSKAPWDLSLRKQRDIVDKIRRATSSVADRYPKLGDLHKDERMKVDYLDLIGWLGANENLRVYSLTMWGVLNR